MPRTPQIGLDHNAETPEPQRSAPVLSFPSSPEDYYHNIPFVEPGTVTLMMCGPRTPTAGLTWTSRTGRSYEINPSRDSTRCSRRSTLIGKDSRESARARAHFAESGRFGRTRQSGPHAPSMNDSPPKR
ncbi:hypothetical protein ABIA39_008598 [Nocardia sp. GAS34]